jgi:predicted GIY-YIG superfamily endonuclease
MYKTLGGTPIYCPWQYAKTGAPMIDKHGRNINAQTSIYKLECAHGKQYIGKTTNMDKRMKQHFTGNGAQVTRKFAPHTSRVVAKCNGYFSDAVEQKVTNNEIKKHGYNCVRGGKYTNSKTFHRRGSGK